MPTRNLSTITQDFQSLWDNAVAPCSEDLKVFCDNVGAAITSSFLDQNKERTVLRMSSIGKPFRQLWYETHYPEMNEENRNEYSLMIKFLYGHILEELLVLLLKTSGHSVEEQQKEHDIDGVKGHQDARVDGVLVDFKSASGRSFAKFKNQRLVEDDPFGYVGQISAYASANNDKEAAFIVIDKQSGEVTVMPIHSLEMIDPEERIQNLKDALEKDVPPDKCYSSVTDGQSGNLKLNSNCNWCRFKFDCWADANDGKGLRGFKYANGIRYLTQVRKVPNVEELTPSF
tara:strand:+ start:969 stop:1829 length:861 start_codon:yes stop_codon:yes gene_type:complete